MDAPTAWSPGAYQQQDASSMGSPKPEMAEPPLDNALNTYQALLTTFSDFLTVAIHTILYERSIYPARTFLSTRKYNFPVRQNRHPKVCKWIMDAVSAVEDEMEKGTVSRVAVIIYAPDAKPLERFMFDVSSFPEIPPAEGLTEFEDAEEGEGQGGGGRWKVSVVDVEEQLRATVRKLAYCGSKLGTLPPGCTYTVAVELKDKADPPIGHPQPWVPSQPSLQISKGNQGEQIGKDIGGVKNVPVRLVEAGAFILEMWIEESQAKQKDKG